MSQQDDEFTNFKSHNYYKSSQYTGMKEQPEHIPELTEDWYIGWQKGVEHGMEMEKDFASGFWAARAVKI